MRIAYITEYDAKDVKQWSGLGLHIANTLISQGFELDFIGPLKVKNSYYHKIKGLLYRKFLKKIYKPNRNPKVVKSFANQIVTQLHPNTDLIFAPSTIPIALLKTEIPIVVFTDATLASMVNFYPEFKNYCKESISDGHKLEKNALKNCSLAIYSSEWAAKSAIQHYGADANKVKVLPFGANLTSSYEENEIVEIIDKRDKDVINLLFLGVYWERKGGDVALKVAEILNDKGDKTVLHIAGIKETESFPDWVKSYGYINKSTKEGMDLINKIISESHFLILPSIADCTPVVFSEANSYGVPCISTNVGGIPSIIKNGINGQLFDLGENPDSYAEYIIETMKNRDRYQILAKSSYYEYKSNLNWGKTGEKLKTLLDEIVFKS